jgi:hypothetical protein
MAGPRFPDVGAYYVGVGAVIAVILAILLIVWVA